MFVQFEMVSEALPGEKWQRFFDRAWPHYKPWFLSEGEDARTDLATCEVLLAKHMPELIPIYKRVCDLAGNDELASRFLSMVNPPAYMAGCSQLAWTGGEPTLFRNYDFNPRLFEGVILRSEWLRPVIGVSEGMWGLLDGMNADGLAACLSFGGRKVSGKGIGIPLIVRYILETCATVLEACKRLQKLPVHMAYSVTLLDAKKSFATVHLSPDRDPVVVKDATCTNHQLGVEWEEYASITQSFERKNHLEKLLKVPNASSKSIVREFLQPPLYLTQYDRSIGTLYTAAYHTRNGVVNYYWPSHSITLAFDQFKEEMVSVEVLPSDEYASDDVH